MATTHDEELVLTHEVVEVPVSPRKKLLRGVGLTLTGVVILLAWGFGAKNGDTAFQISTPFDKYQVPTVRFPGGGAAMIMGGIVIALVGIGATGACGYTAASLALGHRRQRAVRSCSPSCAGSGTGDPGNALEPDGAVRRRR